MFAFMSNRPKAPERVPTDVVVPVGFFDDTIIFRTFVLYTLFVFDDVLDPQRLRDSLERLVSRPGWNKLGARLRRNVRYKASPNLIFKLFSNGLLQLGTRRTRTSHSGCVLSRTSANWFRPCKPERHGLSRPPFCFAYTPSATRRPASACG